MKFVKVNLNLEDLIPEEIEIEFKDVSVTYVIPEPMISTDGGELIIHYQGFLSAYY